MDNTRENKTNKTQTIVGASIIFLTLFLTRIIAAEVPINVDENLWLFRGLNFWGRLSSGNLAETYFQHHPGVPTMWVNGLGIALGCLADTWNSSLDSQPLSSCANLLRSHNFVSVDIYVITRWIQAIITSTLITGAIWLLCRVSTIKIALITISILALEPFFLGYQRLLITDSLQTAFLLVSILSLFLHWRLTSGRFYLIVSGVTMGLAISTKTTSILVFPGLMAIAILTELSYFKPLFLKKGGVKQLQDVGLWSLCILVTFILIWPAMWVAPIETIRHLLQDLRGETQRGFLFFLGRSTSQINALFYPVVLLYRLSPILLIGASISLIMSLFPSWRDESLYHKQIIANLILVLSFLLVLSLPGNKLDRYILPIVPFLVINAAIAWRFMFHKIKHLIVRTSPASISGRVNQIGGGVYQVSLLLFLVQSLTVAPYFPYYISYYNPLIGGAKTAQFVLMMGNGEALDLAAAWLNQQANSEALVAASRYRSVLGPYLTGEALGIPRGFRGGLTQRWLRNANFLIFYINQVQRQIPNPEVVEYFARQSPLHTIELNGINYASIYPGPIARTEDMQNLITPQETIESEGLQLRGYTLTSERLTPGDDLELTLYWDILQEIPSQTTFSLSINQGNTSVMVIPRVMLQGFLGDDPIEPGKTIRDLQFLSFPVTLPPGDYSIGISLSSPVSSSEEALVDVATDIPRTLGLFEMLPSED
ncbi:hypothetical protein E1H12_17960 [Geitlerinema sp. P-1104]|uniref:ArnT family glycosyltransferase n=1 Tax=Geitlerinema sp. P-1104 TaxID=2546230 RepID=UPI001477014F|nr:glycosyltransferase family 39 protein [Geitlerinema sp. P-1104]NMG60350.1 hypothetical protein [Geitlerinema sp. P-1104]